MRVAMRPAVIVAVLFLTVFLRAMRGIRGPGGPMRVFVLVRVVSMGIIMTGHFLARIGVYLYVVQLLRPRSQRRK
jgi:hypothetical protein